MADPRFFPPPSALPLREIAALTHAEIVAPAGCSISDAEHISIKDVAPLDRAGAQDISFLDNSKYGDLFRASKAGACFLRSKNAASAPPHMILLVTQDPYRAFAVTAQKLYPRDAVSSWPAGKLEANIHPLAQIGNHCTIAPGAVIEENVSIGDHTVIMPGAWIGRGVSIGSHCHIGVNAALSHCLLGNHVVIHRHVCIGQEGFGFAMGREGHVKVPQLGRVLIEDEVEIGAGTCIDRGTGPDTVIGAGTKIDNLVQVGHNVQIGKRCIIVSQVGISGSTRIGDGAVLAGQVGIAGHQRRRGRKACGEKRRDAGYSARRILRRVPCHFPAGLASPDDPAGTPRQETERQR